MLIIVQKSASLVCSIVRYNVTMKKHFVYFSQCTFALVSVIKTTRIKLGDSVSDSVSPAFVNLWQLASKAVVLCVITRYANSQWTVQGHSRSPI